MVYKSWNWEIWVQRKMMTILRKYDEINQRDMSDDKDSDERYDIDKND